MADLKKRALRNFQHDAINSGNATIDDVEESSLGIEGWANAEKNPKGVKDKPTDPIQYTEGLIKFKVKSDEFISKAFQDDIKFEKARDQVF